MKKEQENKEEELVDLWEGIEMEEDTSFEEMDEEPEEQKEEQEEPSKESSEESTEDVEEESSEEDQKEEEQEEESSEEEVPLVEEIRQKLGYEFDEEFEDTEEGIQRLVELSAKKLADETIDSIFSEYPEVKQLYQYRAMGGDPDKFFQTRFPEVDYNKVEFNKEDETQHEQLVRQELRARGYTQDEIEAEIEDYKNGGILTSKAERALNALAKKQEEDKNKLIKQQEEAYQQQQREIKEYWDSVRDTIEKSSTFKSFSIPSRDKDNFFDYISKPVEKGKSRRDLDVEKADLETRLAIDYLLFKGFNIQDLIDRKAKDKNAKSLRNRIKQAKMRKKGEERKMTGALEELDEL